MDIRWPELYNKGKIKSEVRISDGLEVLPAIQVYKLYYKTPKTYILDISRVCKSLL